MADLISRHPANKGAMLTPRLSAILTSCAGGAIYGLGTGIISGLSDPLIKDVYFSGESKSTQSLFSGTLTASVLLGAFIGCFMGVDFGNRLGRRMSFKIAGANAVIASVLLAFMPNFPALVVMRTLLGLSVGLCTALCPWYVTDSIPPERRGSIGTIFQINICGFILVAQLINYAMFPSLSDDNLHMPEWKWRLQLALSAIPGLALLIISFIIHESPAYLQGLEDKERLTQGQPMPSDGHHQLGHPIATEEVETTFVASTASGVPTLTPEKQGWGVLFSAAHIKWVFIGLILSASNQLTGINAIMFYSPKIFSDAGLGNPLVMTFSVVGCWNLVSVFISFLLVDRLGRRPLMLGALFFMAMGAGLMALAYQAFPDQKGPAAIIAIILFVGAFECGPGPLFFIMAVETFPVALRDVALSVTQSSVWIFSIVITFGFPVINDAAGPAATFLIFTCLAVVGLVLIFFFVPEPQGVRPSLDHKEVNSAGTEEMVRSRAGSTAYEQL